MMLNPEQINGVNAIVEGIKAGKTGLTISPLPESDIQNIASAMEYLGNLHFKFRGVNYLNYNSTLYLGYAAATASAFKQLLGNVSIQGMLPEIGNYIKVGDISPDAFEGPDVVQPAGMSTTNWQFTAQAGNTPELWISNAGGNFVLPTTVGQRYALLVFGFMRIGANANITRIKIESFGKYSYNTWMYVEKLLRNEDIGIFQLQVPMFAMPGDPIKIARTDNTAGAVDEIAPYGLMFTENIASQRYNVNNTGNDTV